MESSWHEIQGWLKEVFAWAGVEGLEAEELSVIPGLDEVFALSDIKQHATSGEWDVVVVDCAPTAETIRLLSLPDVLARYMERLFPVGRRVNKVVSPVLSRITTLPVAGDDVFEATRGFYERLEGVRELLLDPARTSIRLVVNPEKMVIAEARRTYTYLSLFGYGVDAVVANRLLPDEVSDPWFERWKALHTEHLHAIEEGFAPLPVLKVHLAAAELVGVDALRSFGAAVYGEHDAASRLHEGQPLRVHRRNGRTTLSLELPFADRGDLELGRRGDELLVRVGPYRRAVTLPDSLRSKPVCDATLKQGTLKVVFEGSAADGR
jgi:arsenite-transporting ATPase